MAGNTATLAIRIVSDARKASAGFADAESKVAGFQRGLDKASVAAGGVLAGLGALAKGAFDAASELQQSTGAIDSIFGDWAIDIEQAAQAADQIVGLSTSAYENAASLLGAQLKNMGFNSGDTMDKTKALIGVGADLAATFGGSTADAVAALSSALKGERDPIERYGVSLTQAAIDAKVAALGLDTSTDAAKRAAGAQATLAIIADQTASSQGAFAREADTAAGAQQRAAASFENAQAALGEALLPVVADAATKFADLTKTLTEHSTATQVVAGVVGGLALAVLAINAGMKVYAAYQALATAATWLFNTALLANPITWVVVAIAALIAAVVLAYNKFKWFRDLIQSVWEWLKKAWDFAGKAISVIGSGLFGASQTLAVTPVATGPVQGLYGAADAASMGLYGAPATVLAGGGSTAGQGSTPGPSTTINVTVNGAVDPMATGRQLVKILKDYGVATGGQVVVTLGGRA